MFQLTKAVSEVNCMDESFASKNAIFFVPTACQVTAAGCNAITLVGQTKNDIILKINCNKKLAHVHIGQMIVVKNLGVDILLGEPGKLDNAIVTIPHKKVVKFLDLNNRRMVVPYSYKREEKGNINLDVFRCKAKKNEVIYQDQLLQIKLPPNMKKDNQVVFVDKISISILVLSRRF